MNVVSFQSRQWGRRDIRQDVRMKELKKVEKTLKKLLTSETWCDIIKTRREGAACTL